MRRKLVAGNWKMHGRLAANAALAGSIRACSGDYAGIDLWHLLSLFFVNPGSPAYVQLALAGIHDPDGLGTRAMMEILGALGGVLVAWLAFESRGDGRQAP